MSLKIVQIFKRVLEHVAVAKQKSAKLCRADWFFFVTNGHLIMGNRAYRPSLYYYL